MRSRFTALLLCAPILFVLLNTGGCKSTSTNPSDPNAVTTTVSGVVVDESGMTVSDAEVRLQNSLTHTNQSGSFEFQNIAVSADHAVVTIQKANYFSAVRSFTPEVNGVSQIRVGLMSAAAQGKFDGSSGATIYDESGSASVTFPPSALALASGGAYNGQVYYSVHFLNPEAFNFFDFCSGDLRAKNKSGALIDIQSFGILRIDLRDAAGNLLVLRDGKRASLTIPISTEYRSVAPDTIAMSHYDAQLSIWVEEGVANNVGQTFVGQVSQVSDWNFDYPVSLGNIEIEISCTSATVPNVWVNVGQNIGYSNAAGIVKSRIPVSFPIPVMVRPENNNGLVSAQVISVVHSATDVEHLSLPIFECPSFIQGTIVDCAGNPIDGRVVIDYENGTSDYHYVKGGNFRFHMNPFEAYQFYGVSADGQRSHVYADKAADPGEKRTPDTLVCCSQEMPFTDIHLNYSDAHVLRGYYLSANGEILVAASFAKLYIFNTSTGSLISSVDFKDGDIPSTYLYSLGMSDDASVLLANFGDSDSCATIDVNTGKILAKFGAPSRSLAGASAISPDGTLCVTPGAPAYNGNQISLWDAHTGKALRDVVVNYDGKHIYGFISNDGILTSDSWERLSVYNIDGTQSGLYLNFQAATMYCYSMGGTNIIGMSDNSGWNIYSLQTHDSVRHLPSVPLRYPDAYAFASDNDHFIISLPIGDTSAAQDIHSVSNANYALSLPMPDAMRRCYKYIFSRNGNKLVGVFPGNSLIRIWTWR